MNSKEWVSLWLATMLVGYLGIRIINTTERLKPFKEALQMEDANFRTGDLFLFHSNFLLMLLIDSPFSHVGIVIVLHNTPYLFEIVPTNSVCTLTPVNRTHFPMDEEIFYRPIEASLDEDRVLLYLHEVSDRVYDYGAWLPLLQHAFDHIVFPRLPKRRQTGSFSCASLVGNLLQRFGVMKEKNDFVPEDFSSLRHLGRWGVERRLV